MKEIKVTNRKIIAIWNVINSLQEMNMMGAKYKYWLSINKKNVEDFKEIINESVNGIPAIEGFKAFADHRIQLCKEIDMVEGQNILHKEFMPNGAETYKIDNEEEFEVKIAPLKEKYKEAIEENDKRDKEINDLLDQEVEVKLFVINIDNIPDEIPDSAVDVLLDAIES